MHSDAFRCIPMHSDAFRSRRIRSDPIAQSNLAEDLLNHVGFLFDAGEFLIQALEAEC